ncbi:hypothetical protein G1H11_06530 [Phytoactinopolyspora alkaliphila]|uniref:Uncharacterized protein n=1 Tax=Phytoactinopolyspora alkaliphila TaxID=1783498 RepID=A0A6N9YIX5_9ACTN|nr:hypothetical protein [Phytoactinopolyspora alkaliphila]NED94966.1 hypothetical protein [Phytoactinopolyspora alkaliphila]
MPSARLPLAAAALAAVLGLASTSGSVLLAVGIAIVQIVFALGVVGSSDLSSARAAGWLGLTAGIGALVWIELSGTADLTPMAGVLGPTVLAAFVIQLLRRDGRSGLNTALSLVVTACVLIVMPVLWLSLHTTPEGTHTVTLALLGVGTVALAEALPISRAVRRVVGVLVASTGAAVLVSLVNTLGEAVPAVSAVVIAAFAGVMSAVAFAVADRLAGESGLGLPVASPNDDDLSGAADAEPGLTASGAGGVAAPATNVPVTAAATNAPASIAPLRVVGPFVAAAPAAYVLGQLLVG